MPNTLHAPAAAQYELRRQPPHAGSSPTRAPSATLGAQGGGTSPTPAAPETRVCVWGTATMFMSASIDPFRYAGVVVVRSTSPFDD